ncbi:MAG: hypothetical protein D6692_09770 [Planctomycetota bacterium]|nr:MAG: hypothetical protein D6692_09770 [Planctomycetota bacterium]
MPACPVLVLFLMLQPGENRLPLITVDRDDIFITESCRVFIPPGTVITDDENDGVIQIAADGVRLVFEPGSVLIGREGLDRWLREGPAAGEGWDTLTGTGIAVDGHEGVAIVNASVRGFRVGVLAREADGLRIENATLTDLWRQRLTSTATREGADDWLWPHKNDDNEWLTNYGAAVWVEDSEKVSLRAVTVRRGQNGIVLDATNGSSVSECDASFLSGWGLAMWRASDNEIKDNRFDFCVRGHVEGVYNRGQDSAGILMFEACRDNRIISNSATHSGDGIFGFGGNDAIELVQDGPWGNAGNRFVSNDLSFAPAHGLEMTFSEQNYIGNNLFESNAICGIWGGYSRRTTISENTFIANGGMAYGRERGAINIEHGSGNIITRNRFTNNKVGVRLWWDFDAALLSKPGVQAGYRGVQDNEIDRNHFVMQSDHPFGQAVMVGVEIDDIGEAPGYDGPRVGSNVFERSQNSWEIEEGAGVPVIFPKGQLRPKKDPEIQALSYMIPPRPDRIHPSGREWIVVDDWGPWDFETPLLREHSRSSNADTFELYPPRRSTHEPSVTIDGADAELLPPAGLEGWRPWLVRVTPRDGQAVSAYTGTVRCGNWTRPIAGRFVRAAWSVRVWSWTSDPLEDLDAWRAEAGSVGPIETGSLDLPFGYAGPSSVQPALKIDARDRFGLIAEGSIDLPPGRWRVRTRSDDGIRVAINDELLIERWDIHGPTEDAAEFEVAEAGPTRIGLEYFENAGYATLSVWFEPAD